MQNGRLFLAVLDCLSPAVGCSCNGALHICLYLLICPPIPHKVLFFFIFLHGLSQVSSVFQLLVPCSLVLKVLILWVSSCLFFTSCWPSSLPSTFPPGEQRLHLTPVTGSRDVPSVNQSRRNWNATGRWWLVLWQEYHTIPHKIYYTKFEIIKRVCLF